MNVADSQTIASILCSSGFCLVDDIDLADILIFNTCSVRKHAETRAIGRISNEMARKRENPNLLIGVVGCMAQRKKSKLLKTGVDFVVGVDEYLYLPSVLSNLKPLEKSVSTKEDKTQTYEGVYPKRDKSNVGFVSIARGCNNFCSYCIVPYVRGRERSRSVVSIFKEVKKAASEGISEVVLLGQNVNSYKYQKSNFSQLLGRVSEVEGIKRIRFITSHPKDLSFELIDQMRQNTKICEHIHLPLQSGDNDILAAMNRGYTIEHFYSLVDCLRENIADISITTDVMVGFPTESGGQFENTLAAVEKIGFDTAFMFKYSTRSGTLAAKMGGQIDERVKLSRLQKLIEVQSKITQKKYAKKIGKTAEILVEGTSKKGGSQLFGKTRDFKIAVFDGDEKLIGKLVNIKITDSSSATLKGELL